MNNFPGGLFVGDLSVCFQEGHLRELFQPFGTILKTELRQGFKAHKLLGHGFVTFSTFEEADNAMKHMQGFLVLGRRLRIIWASNNNSFHKETVCAEVVFSFVSKQLTYMVYEQTIRDLFSGYGCDVIDVSLKQFKLEENLGKQSGIGFVHFPLTPQGILAAKMAVDQLTNVSIREIMYDSELSMNLQTIIEDNPHLDTPFTPVHPPPIKGVPKQRRGASTPITLPFELPYQRKSAFAHLIRHSNVMGGMGMNNHMNQNPYTQNPYGHNPYGQNQQMDIKFGRQAQLLAHSYVPCYYAEPIPAPIAMPPAPTMTMTTQQKLYASQGMTQAVYQAELAYNAEEQQDPTGAFQFADETRSEYPHERRLSVDVSATTSCEEIQVPRVTHQVTSSPSNEQTSAQTIESVTVMEGSAQTDSDTDNENEASATTTLESSVDDKKQVSSSAPPKSVAAALVAAVNAPEFVPQAMKATMHPEYVQQQVKIGYTPVTASLPQPQFQQSRYNSQTRQDIADQRMRSRTGQTQGGQLPLSSQQWTEQYHNEQGPNAQQYQQQQQNGQYPAVQHHPQQHRETPTGPSVHRTALPPPQQQYRQQPSQYQMPSQRQQQQQQSGGQQYQGAPRHMQTPAPRPSHQYADNDPHQLATDSLYEDEYYQHQQGYQPQTQTGRAIGRFAPNAHLMVSPEGMALHKSHNNASSPQQKQLELQRERALLLRRQQQLEAELAGISPHYEQRGAGQFFEDIEEQPQEEFFSQSRQKGQAMQRVAPQSDFRNAPLRPLHSSFSQQPVRRRYADETEEEYQQYLEDTQYAYGAGSYDQYERARRPVDPYAQQAPPPQRRDVPMTRGFAPPPRQQQQQQQQYFGGGDEEEQYAYDSAEEQQLAYAGRRGAFPPAMSGRDQHRQGRQQNGLLSSILSEVDYSFGGGSFSSSSGVAPLDLSGFDSDLFR